MLYVTYTLFISIPAVLSLAGLMFFAFPASAKKRLNTGSINLSIKQLILITALAAAGMYFSYDIQRKALFATDYYVNHKNWDKVLQYAKKHTNSYFTINAANQALYHKGELLQKLFEFPQNINSLMLTMPQLMHAHWNRFPVFMELGLMNLAEHELIESIEKFGEKPILLKNMAIVYLVKDDISAARIYLHKLTKTLFDSKWAKDYLEKIKIDPDLSSDQNIQKLRSLNLSQKDNYPFVELDREKLLKGLLNNNSKNKMAFDYLICWYLLSKQIDKIAINYPMFQSMGYSELPLSCQQALMIYARKKSSLNVPKDIISPEAEKIFLGINRMLHEYRGDKKRAMFKIATQYGSTFTFYFIYNMSGLGK